MGNTNFQTIHQMGTAISDFVKQATGRDNVQNIDMDHITVAQNHRYEEVDVSGRVVSFYAGEAGLPFEKMVVQIAPVQDLHGYDHPWPGGGGKNKLNPLIVDDTNRYINARDGSITEPTPEGGIWRCSDYIPVTPGDELFFGEIFADASLAGSAWYDSNKRFVSGFSATELKRNAGVMIVPDGVSYLRHSWRIDGRYNTNWESTVYITFNSDPHEFSPYSNICPITGWTMVNVYQAGQNMEDARVYRFTFPSEAGIVYGGTLDVVTGVLTVDMAEVDMGSMDWAASASYGFTRFFTTIAEKANGQTNLICGAFAVETDAVGANQHDNTVKGISSSNAIYVRCDSIADASSFKTAMSGVQLVYKLSTPLTYQLTPQEITTLLGTNNIWADTGEIEVKFTNVKELY